MCWRSGGKGTGGGDDNTSKEVEERKRIRATELLGVDSVSSGHVGGKSLGCQML